MKQLDNSRFFLTFLINIPGRCTLMHALTTQGWIFSLIYFKQKTWFCRQMLLMPQIIFWVITNALGRVKITRKEWVKWKFSGLVLHSARVLHPDITGIIKDGFFKLIFSQFQGSVEMTNSLKLFPHIHRKVNIEQ